MALTVSSNTLFHFTNSYDALLGILEHEFQPRYCLENFTGLAAPAEDDGPELAFPIVCFCDLPLSQTAAHLEMYGNYGIGLTKEWGMRQHLSPVLYGHHGSGAYHEMMETYKALHAGSAGQLDPDLERRFFGFLSFVKPYEGTFWRAGAYVPHVRFYDEREWRYVPALETDELFLEKDNYLDDKRRDEANKRIAADYRLRFSPEDIRYIIVGSDEEILPMVDAVLHIKGRNYTYDDLRLLTTRIISATQIKEDF